MSFVKTLATLAVGFAAARGMDKLRQMGGAEGVKNAMMGGDLGAQMGEMAEKMGLPGGKDMLGQMMGQFGAQAQADGASEAAQVGLGNLMAAMTGATAAGAAGMSDLFGAMTAGTPLASAAEDNARLMIRAMIQSAKADGEIDAAEQRAILDHLGDVGEEELAFVKAELRAPMDITALVQEVGDSARAQVYSAALMPIQVDTDAERQYLAQLGQGLGLSPEKLAQIHAAMGKRGL